MFGDNLQVKDYILELESHMAETHRQASKLIKRQGELGLSLGEFGSSLMVLGKFEQSALADHFVNIGEKSQKLAKQSQVSSKAFQYDSAARDSGRNSHLLDCSRNASSHSSPSTSRHTPFLQARRVESIHAMTCRIPSCKLCIIFQHLSSDEHSHTSHPRPLELVWMGLPAIGRRSLTPLALLAISGEMISELKAKDSCH